MSPAVQTVDNPIVINLQALDQYGNIAKSQSLGVSIVLNSLAPQLVSISAGVGSYVFSRTTPQTISLSLVDSQSTNLIVSSTSSVTILPGLARSFVLPAPVSVTAGDSVSVTIAALDQYSNIATAKSSYISLIDDLSQNFNVTISAGIGSQVISTNLSVLVHLSLIDIAATGLNVSSKTTINFLPGLTVLFFIILCPYFIFRINITIRHIARDCWFS